MQRFLTIGEVMLRLTPPNCNKIRTATEFEASYGGSEANIAISLANLGMDATFFTVVPDNSLGKSAVRALRANDVHCSPVIYATETDVPTHRLGTYYLEMGFGIRASKVIYDRKHSAFSEYDYSRVDLDKLLSGYDWLHLSGITPALSPSCQDLVLAALKTRELSRESLDLGGGTGLLHPMPSLCRRPLWRRAISPLEGRERSRQGGLEGWHSPAALP